MGIMDYGRHLLFPWLLDFMLYQLPHENPLVRQTGKCLSLTGGLNEGHLVGSSLVRLMAL